MQYAIACGDKDMFTPDVIFFREAVSQIILLILSNKFLIRQGWHDVACGFFKYPLTKIN